jgi:hypothetical protein
MFNMINCLTRKTLILAAIALSSCQSVSTPNSKSNFMNYVSPYPKDSIVSTSKSLEDDAIRGLKLYLKDVFGSDTFEIIERSSVDEKLEIYTDQRGRLRFGNIHEIWTIKHSGAVHKHHFFMYPDGKGGNFVVFGLLKKSSS